MTHIANVAVPAIRRLDAKGHSSDWRRWDVTAMGYEGYLTDNYDALLAAALRQSEARWNDDNHRSIFMALRKG